MKTPLLLLLAVPVWLSACSPAPKAEVAPAPTAVPATVVEATAAQLPQIIPLSGTVRARETAAISALMPGQIQFVLARAGDHVRAGQVLVTLEAATQAARLRQSLAAQQAVEQQQQAATTQAALAASTLRRYASLQRENSVSAQEFDEVRQRAQAAALQVRALTAQAEAAQAAVAGARAALDQMRLRAPFAGVVTARLADPGTLAAPGVALLQVDRDGPLQAQVTLDESLLGRIRTGMTLPVELASSARPIAGTVAEIAPGADPASRSFLVKLNLPATPAARAGVSVTVALPGAVQSVVEAPVAAIVHREALDYVYVLDAHAIARLRYVTLGAREGDRVVVLSGLEAGERLVAGAADRDLAGQPIEAQ